MFKMHDFRGAYEEYKCNRNLTEPRTRLKSLFSKISFLDDMHLCSRWLISPSAFRAASWGSCISEQSLKTFLAPNFQNEKDYRCKSESAHHFCVNTAQEDLRLVAILSQRKRTWLHVMRLSWYIDDFFAELRMPQMFWSKLHKARVGFLCRNVRQRFNDILTEPLLTLHRKRPHQLVIHCKRLMNRIL